MQRDKLHNVVARWLSNLDAVLLSHHNLPTTAPKTPKKKKKKNNNLCLIHIVEMIAYSLIDERCDEFSMGTVCI